MLLVIFPTDTHIMDSLKVAIKKAKNRLTLVLETTGANDDFGKDEVARLRSTYGDMGEIDTFNEWCVKCVFN